MKRKLKGFAIIAAGIVLIFSALSLFLYNQQEDALAGQEAEDRLDKVQAVIREKSMDSLPGAELPEEEVDENGQTQTNTEKRESAPVQKPKTKVPAENLDDAMPVEEIEGYGYIGYLTIPSLNLELPVLSEWDEARLKIGPCRHFGSSRTDDLVIAAHNYRKHFGTLDRIAVGDPVIFTDMDGVTNEYEAEKIDTLAATAVEEVQKSGYDLVLYTCTYSGKTRTVVFCSRTEEAYRMK